MGKSLPQGMKAASQYTGTVEESFAADKPHALFGDHTAGPPQTDTLGSPAGSQKSSSDGDDGSHDRTQEELQASSSAPVQKRRRVTRACDECRRKKIKCDGKQPCTHCSVYSYECTYDKPSNRRRNPAPQYVEALEDRLQRAETMLRRFLPDVDLTDPNLDPAVQHEFRTREITRKKLHGISSAADDSHENATLASMVESVGTLNLDDDGGWDFHGSSSSTMFLHRMKEHFKDILGPGDENPLLLESEDGNEFESKGGDIGSPGSAISSFGLTGLPSKELARSLCYYSLTCATCLSRIVHIPSFDKMFDSIYDDPSMINTTYGRHSLALIHSVLALGHMYRNLDPASGVKSGYQAAIEEGMKYHETAKRLIGDITECRDLKTLQALLFIILFVQASSSLTTCYSLIGVALRSALRMGLHRNLKHEKMTPIEVEERRRVFYVIRQLDVSVSAMLGFPLLLQPEDVDQKYPTEVDDEFIRSDGIDVRPHGESSFFEAFNAHTRLIEILAKVLKYVYPTKGASLGKGASKLPSTYLVSYSRIREIEKELQKWFEELPAVWRPGSDGNIERMRVQHLLRFTYAHVQLVLYRPFLHYVSPRLAQGKAVDEVSYACAAAAISVSRNLVHIGIEIRKQGVLIGPYWFMLYTEFFAVLSLVFYATENPSKNGTSEVLSDACAGRDMVAKFAEQSMAADRVTKALTHLFDKLPESLVSSQSTAIPNRKRSIPIRDDPRAGYAQGDLSRSQAAAPYTMRGVGSIPNSLIDPSFSPNMAELMPMDMSTRGTPESTGTGEGSVAGKSYPASASGATISRLNALMFPSNDPFAYPTHPPIDVAFSNRPVGQAATDVSGYYSHGNNAFTDLPPQLVAPVPQFMLAQGGQTLQHGNHSSANNMAFSGNVFVTPQGIGSVDQSPEVQTAVPHRRTQRVPAMYPTTGYEAGQWEDLFGDGLSGL